MSPREAEEIEEKARAFGVSIPQFLRDSAIHRPLRSRVDFSAVNELIRLNTNQAHLGGILKKWLIGVPQPTSEFNGDTRGLLQNISLMQAEIRGVVKKVGKLKDDHIKSARKYAVEEVAEDENKSVNKQVRMTPEEAEEIKMKARAFGVSVPQYLRDCGMDRPLRSTVDFRAIKALNKLNADQGRLGGLLKKWLTEDWRPATGFNVDIGALLRDIGKVQAEIEGVLKTVASIRQ